MCSVSLPSAARKVGSSWGEMVADEEQEGLSRPSCPRTCFWLGKPLHTDVFSLLFPAGQRCFIVNGRALPVPLCLGGGGLKKHPNSGHLCSSDSQKACTQHQPSPLPKTSKQFLFKKNCPELGKLGWGRRRAGELGAAWTLPNELLAQVRGREIIFSEDGVATS